MRTAIAALLCALALSAAAEPPADPLRSTQWPVMAGLLFGEAPVVFDPRVEVLLPPEAEDSMNVPVAVRWGRLPEVRKLIAFVDFNPIPLALEYEPRAAKPFLGFRVRVQQATPIRVAAQTADGVWHVGGGWVDAAGGGCTLPPNLATRVRDEDIGRVHARRWPLEGGGQRLKLRVTHPNDTGLIANMPAFYVESLAVADAQGRELARLATHQPLCESPVLSLELGAEGPLTIDGRDNGGNRIEARVE